MDKVRDFIRERLEKLDLAQSEVSLALGKNHAYLQQYLNRGTPRVLDEETRQKLAGLLKCDQNLLKETRPESNSTAGLPGASHRHNTPGLAGPLGGPAKDRTLPIYGRAQAGSYGIVIIPTDDRPVDWTYRPDQLAGVDDAFATYIYGDSMSPAYEPGDIAFVHPHAAKKAGDDIHIIMNNDEAFVKRLVAERNGVLVVKQFNPPQQFEIALAEVRYWRKVSGKWAR